MPPTTYLVRLSCLMVKHNYSFIPCNKGTNIQRRLNKRKESHGSQQVLQTKDKGQLRFDKTLRKISFLSLNVLVKLLRQSFTFLCFPQTVKNSGRARGRVGGIMLNAVMTNI